jgi:hypothetical protein
MPYSPSGKIIFIHIPKTGGTSIEYFFDLCHPDCFWFDRWDLDQEAFIRQHKHRTKSPGIYFEPQHYTPEVLKDLIPDYNQYFKFTFIRNPYTKLLSEYYWLRKTQLNSIRDFSPGAFHSWCKKFLKQVPNSHCEPQSNYVDHSIDFTGRYENLETDFASLIHIMKERKLIPGDTPSSLPNKLSTGIEKSQLIAFIKPKTKELIQKRFLRDFDQFGYEI